MKKLPILYIIIPCYNEEAVLKITGRMFLGKLTSLINNKMISDDSRILFVNDGSLDKTWEVILEYSKADKHFCGISQSRNMGHQNALLAGLSEAAELCDITVSIDCDGQDDLNAIDKMIEEYKNGCDIVYGVRRNRDTDTGFKRLSAHIFYKFMNFMGAEVIYDHADYRLISARALKELLKFDEVNIFLRGMIPLVGFKSTCVYYDRGERLAGKSHYPLKKMIRLALDGITSLSIKPIRLITMLGIICAGFSVIGIIYALVSKFTGNSNSGWTSIICMICFLTGIQLISLGVIGEYIGKIYLETKHRPRYIISERTYENDTDEDI